MPAKKDTTTRDEGASANASRAFEQICAHVREQLAAGTLKIGDRLPTERELAEQFGVGINAVREAKRSLEMAGIVRVEKGRNGGAFIRPGNSSRMTLAMRDLLDFGSINLLELISARTLIMDNAIRLSAGRISDADFHRMEQLVDQAEEAKKQGKVEHRVELITEVYATIARCAGNRVLFLIVASLNETVVRFIDAAKPVPPAKDRRVASIRKLLRHLQTGEIELASAEMQMQFMDLYKLLDTHLKAQEKVADVIQRVRAVLHRGAAPLPEAEQDK